MSEKDNRFEIETIMARVAEQRILTSEVLGTESRSKERENAIERLKDGKTHEDTEESKAQEAVFEYILHLGGVREDVYDLLLTLQWKNIASAATLRPFLYYAASPEWIELAAEVQEKTESFFMNELVAAYKDGIPIEAVRKCINGSRTLFEMCQCRMQYIRHMKEQTERNLDRAAVPDVTETSILKDLIADLKKMISDNYSQRELSDIVTRSQRKELSDSVTQSKKEELSDSVTRSKKEELSDSVTRSKKEEPDDTMSQSQEKESGNVVSQSIKNPPEFPKGEEVMESRLLIADLEEKEKAAGKRISFFTELLKMHQKKLFARLDEKAQVGKLFEIMIGKRYGKKKIMAMKKLMDGGMTKEFVFSLIEKDLPEDELIELCDTLLSEDAGGLEPNTTGIDDKKQETSDFEQEMADDSQEEFQEEDEYEIMDM